MCIYFTLIIKLVNAISCRKRGEGFSPWVERTVPIPYATLGAKSTVSSISTSLLTLTLQHFPALIKGLWVKLLRTNFTFLDKQCWSGCYFIPCFGDTWHSNKVHHTIAPSGGKCIIDSLSLFKCTICSYKRTAQRSTKFVT